MTWKRFLNCASLAIAVSGAVSAAPSYQVVDLTPVVKAEARPSSIAKNFVAGNTSIGGPWVYEVGAPAATWIPIPSNQFAVVTAVNEHGAAVGWIDTSAGRRGFFFADGVFSILPIEPAPGGRVEATAIDAAGRIAGHSDSKAFIYDDGAITNLGTLGGRFSIPRGIDRSAGVVGYSELANGAIHAFVYDGQLRDLGTLGTDLVTFSFGFGINRGGLAVGYSGQYGFPPTRAVLFDGSGPHDLGLMPGYSGARAWAINKHGDVVGQVEQSASTHAIVVRDGVMWDLNQVAPSTFTLVDAIGISDEGIIVGTANANPNANANTSGAIAFIALRKD
jgi:probable HAF family extracellular repeat protein